MVAGTENGKILIKVQKHFKAITLRRKAVLENGRLFLYDMAGVCRWPRYLGRQGDP